MNNPMASSLSNKLASILLAWWKENKEWYPFRATSDPYRILVSEILLRKTRANQVAAVYHDFFEKFPNPCAVMNSTPEDVADIIKPLGLVSRADHIFAISKILCEQRDGEVPSTEKGLKALPGVGEYIANVVLTMGFNNPKPMVDSNVKRVLSRIIGIEPNSREASRQVWNTYDEILPKEGYRDFHFAIIDLAHQLCIPLNPLCFKCPVNTLCHFFQLKMRI